MCEKLRQYDSLIWNDSYWLVLILATFGSSHQVGFVALYNLWSISVVVQHLEM